MKAGFLLVVLLVGLAAAAHAASGTWSNNGSTDGNWTTTSNWVGSTVPGSNSTTTNTDTATFNASVGTFGTSGSPVVIDTGRNIKSISFDTSAGNFTIGSTGGNPLKLTAAGAISLLSTVSGTNVIETINAPLTFQGSTYGFSNNRADAGSALVFGGTITNAATSTLTISGNGTGTGNLISGAINDGTGVQSVTITATAGKWTLSGASNYSGLTSITGAGSTTVFQGNNTSSGAMTLNGAGAAVQLDNATVVAQAPRLR